MARQRGGSIINMSSVVGVSGNAGQCNYSASKAGMIGLAKSIAKEMGPRGIRANCIAPGFIITDMTNQLSQEVRDAWAAQIHLPTWLCSSPATCRAMSAVRSSTAAAR